MSLRIFVNPGPGLFKKERLSTHLVIVNGIILQSIAFSKAQLYAVYRGKWYKIFVCLQSDLM